MGMLGSRHNHVGARAPRPHRCQTLHNAEWQSWLSAAGHVRARAPVVGLDPTIQPASTTKSTAAPQTKYRVMARQDRATQRMKELNLGIGAAKKYLKAGVLLPLGGPVLPGHDNLRGVANTDARFTPPPPTR